MTPGAGFLIFLFVICLLILLSIYEIISSSYFAFYLYFECTIFLCQSFLFSLQAYCDSLFNLQVAYKTTFLIYPFIGGYWSYIFVILLSWSPSVLHVVFRTSVYKQHTRVFKWMSDDKNVDIFEWLFWYWTYLLGTGSWVVLKAGFE